MSRCLLISAIQKRENDPHTQFYLGTCQKVSEQDRKQSTSIKNVRKTLSVEGKKKGTFAMKNNKNKQVQCKIMTNVGKLNKGSSL